MNKTKIRCKDIVKLPTSFACINKLSKRLKGISSYFTGAKVKPQTTQTVDIDTKQAKKKSNCIARSWHYMSQFNFALTNQQIQCIRNCDPVTADGQKLLVKYKDAKTKDGASILFLACAAGNLAAAKYCIETLNMDINSTYEIDCIRHCNPLTAEGQTLLRTYNAANAKTKDGASILFLVCAAGNLAAAKYCIETLNMDVNSTINDGAKTCFEHPLHWLIQDFGHWDQNSFVKPVVKEIKLVYVDMLKHLDWDVEQLTTKLKKSNSMADKKANNELYELTLLTNLIADKVVEKTKKQFETHKNNQAELSQKKHAIAVLQELGWNIDQLTESQHKKLKELKIDSKHMSLKNILTLIEQEKREKVKKICDDQKKSIKKKRRAEEKEKINKKIDVIKSFLQLFAKASKESLNCKNKMGYTIWDYIDIKLCKLSSTYVKVFTTQEVADLQQQINQFKAS